MMNDELMKGNTFVLINNNINNTKYHHYNNIYDRHKERR